MPKDHVVTLPSGQFMFIPIVWCCLNLGQRHFWFCFAVGSCWCRHSKLATVLRISDHWMPSSKRDIYIGTSIVIPSGQLRQEECKSWRMGRSSVKCCLQDTTWLLQAWTYSSHGHLHKTCTRRGQSVILWVREGLMRSHLNSRSYCHLVDGWWELGSKFSSGVWLQVGCRHLNFHEIPNAV